MRVMDRFRKGSGAAEQQAKDSERVSDASAVARPKAGSASGDPTAEDRVARNPRESASSNGGGGGGGSHRVLTEDEDQRRSFGDADDATAGARQSSERALSRGSGKERVPVAALPEAQQAWGTEADGASPAGNDANSAAASSSASGTAATASATTGSVSRPRGGGTIPSTLPASSRPMQEDPLRPPLREGTGNEDGGEEAQDEASTPGLLSDAPLVIQADASLVDGLRALLVHHLKRSVGSNVVNLSASQVELLEHHLARLASYATKIVHTLAFATRFLSKQRIEGEGGEPADSPESVGVGGPSGEAPRTVGGSAAAAGGASSGGSASRPPLPAVVEPKPARKALKLNDCEILSLYKSAQAEAAIEADWRGIPGPGLSRANSTCTSRSPASIGTPAGDVASTPKDAADQEYLRMLSRAMQQPGRSPRAFTAEILDPAKDAMCCAPRVGTEFTTKASSSMRAPGSGPPDPGSHRMHSGSHRASYRPGQPPAANVRSP
mmetsp:Transcript_111609/g.279479  ORF Transcript_111609/g.279479 Transcript_111609/m.279479 type:complete len:496 (+) Transcript_111609:97-1584(+)